MNSGYVILSKASWSRRLTTTTVLSLWASTATPWSYAPSNGSASVGGNHSVMQFTRSFPKPVLCATRFFSETASASNDEAVSERSSDKGRRSSAWRSSLLSISSAVFRSPTRNALNTPSSPPQHTQPFRATRHRGLKDRRLIVSVSRVLVFSRWMTQLRLSVPGTGKYTKFWASVPMRDRNCQCLRAAG